MSTEKRIAPSLDSPIRIAYCEADKEDPDELEMYREWRGIPFTEPCGSAYATFGYVELNPKVAPPDYFDDCEYDDMDDEPPKVDIEALQSAHPSLVATAYESLPAAVRAEVQKTLDDPVGSKAHREEACSLVVFAESASPSKWIGVVGFRGHVQSDGREVSVRVGHGFTAINPTYRRQSFAPVVSGMCGWLISESAKEMIEKNFLAQMDAEKPFDPPKRVTVDILASPETVLFPHLIRSFANGVNFFLSAFESEWDWQYKDGKVYSPPPPKYEFRLRVAA